MTEHWYPLVVSAQREIIAVSELLHAGIHAFTPCDKLFVRQSPDGTKVVRDQPLLPKYVFAQSPDWSVISQIICRKTGRKLIRTLNDGNGAPYRLPYPEIVRMMYLAEAGPPQSIPVSRKLSPGDVCTILDGPFAGRRVKVKRDDGLVRRWCEQIGSTLLGRSEMSIPIVQLERAAA